MSKSFSYCFLPGWAENRWKTHLLFSKLNAAGGHTTNDIETADIVITHSAGGHFTHSAMAAKLVVIIGPIYGQGRPLIVRTAQEWFFDNIYYFRRGLIWAWLTKNLYYLYFGIFHPLRSIRIYQSLKQPLDLSLLAKYKVLLIRNQQDYFCSPQISDEVKKFSNISFEQLPGRHDNLWTNPKPYIDLLLRELR